MPCLLGKNHVSYNDEGYNLSSNIYRKIGNIFVKLTCSHVNKTFKLTKSMLNISSPHRCTYHSYHPHDVHENPNWWNEQITHNDVKYNKVYAIPDLKRTNKHSILNPYLTYYVYNGWTLEYLMVFNLQCQSGKIDTTIGHLQILHMTLWKWTGYSWSKMRRRRSLNRALGMRYWCLRPFYGLPMLGTFLHRMIIRCVLFPNRLTCW